MTFLPLQEWLNRSKKKKEKKPLRKVSKGRAKELREYSRLRKIFLAKHPACQICGHEWASEVHHVEGRGKNLNRVSTWKALGPNCHRRIHDNPSWARERGYLK